MISRAVLLLAGVLSVTHVGVAQADEAAMLITPAGVDVRAHLEGGDNLVITILPTMDVKLNGQLGIGVKANGASDGWQDTLPSLLMVDGDYFDGPVLQEFAFDAEAMDMPSALLITFGACLPASGVCILEEAEVTLARETDGSLGLTLAALEP
jgi:hypothetical protein